MKRSNKGGGGAGTGTARWAVQVKSREKTAEAPGPPAIGALFDPG